jgi:hypothetical protein
MAAEILTRAAAKIRSFIRTNITGGADFSYNGPKAVKPQSPEEKLHAAMEDTKFLPPEPIGEDGRLNDKFVEFWADKLVDFFVSLIAAGFAWLFSKVTGHSLFSEAQEHNKQLAEAIVPAAIWLICFLGLTCRRLFHPSKKQ